MNESNQSPVNQVLNELRKEVNLLATEDFSTVVQSVSDVLKKKMSEDPLTTLATAFGIGYGLRTLSSAHYKYSAIHVGKLMAMKALAKLEPNSAAS